MFALPLIALPFVFAAAIYRLYVLPRRLFSSQIHLARSALSIRTALTLLAYSALLGYTAAIAVALATHLPQAISNLTLWLRLGPLLAGYPFVYVAAEWAFYYGFRQRQKQ